ncbi:MAG: hypothetical protein ACYDG6_14630 [Thermincolia bacterium]
MTNEESRNLKFKAGTIFVGNVNKAKMEFVGIKKRQGQSATELAVIKCLKTGKLFTHGLWALERCDVTIIE